MKKISHFDFVVIDDDPLNNLICRKVIEVTRPGDRIVTFLNAQQGLDYVTEYISRDEDSSMILFLNINMPDLSGWDVLDRLEKAKKNAGATLKIYMLSSSSFYDDVQRADSYAIVTDYIGKPLTPVKLEKLLKEV